MPQAVLYLPAAAARAVAGLPLAGRPLAARVIVAAVRAGAGTVGVPATIRTRALEAALHRSGVPASTLRWLDSREPEPADLFRAGPCLLLPASVLVDARTVAGLLEGSGAPGGAACAESVGSGAPVLAAPAGLMQRLWPRLTAGEPLGPELERHLVEARPKLAAAGGLCVLVTGEAALGPANAALYAAMGTDDDTGIDQFLHRRCSRLITRVLVRTRITPNVVTIASLVVGLAAAGCFWQGTPPAALLGLLLYAAAIVLDHTDGELARLTFQESLFGARLDWAVDTVIIAMLVLAMAASAGGGRLTLVAGLAGAVGVTLSALFARYLPRPIAVGESVGGALRNIGNRDVLYLLLLGFVVLRWTLPALLPAVAMIVAVGSQSYWIACVTRIRREGRR